VSPIGCSDGSIALTYCRLTEDIIVNKKHHAYLFGSAVGNRLTSTSDVDFAVAADTRLPLETRLALAAQMAQALRREVDLIDL